MRGRERNCEREKNCGRKGRVRKRKRCLQSFCSEHDGKEEPGSKVRESQRERDREREEIKLSQVTEQSVEFYFRTPRQVSPLSFRPSCPSSHHTFTCFRPDVTPEVFHSVADTLKKFLCSRSKLEERIEKFG